MSGRFVTTQVREVKQHHAQRHASRVKATSQSTARAEGALALLTAK